MTAAIDSGDAVSGAHQIADQPAPTQRRRRQSMEQQEIPPLPRLIDVQLHPSRQVHACRLVKLHCCLSFHTRQLCLLRHRSQNRRVFSIVSAYSTSQPRMDHTRIHLDESPSEPLHLSQSPPRWHSRRREQHRFFHQYVPRITGTCAQNRPPPQLRRWSVMGRLPDSSGWISALHPVRPR